MGPEAAPIPSLPPLDHEYVSAHSEPPRTVSPIPAACLPCAHLSLSLPPPIVSGWDGACLPIGLGLSLILNGIFFAKPLNEMKLLTLPDLFARKFGPATEVLFGILAIISFTALLAGNLVRGSHFQPLPSSPSRADVAHLLDMAGRHR